MIDLQGWHTGILGIPVSFHNFVSVTYSSWGFDQPSFSSWYRKVTSYFSLHIPQHGFELHRLPDA